MAKKVNIQDITVDQLKEDLVLMNNEYQDMKFAHASSTLQNPLQLREKRREIARYMTELRNRQLAEAGDAGRDRLRTRRARIKKSNR